uniref:Uncharacterized protein n=1 Tax=Podarcis muralis TaxID=64176 RepID=A0A670HZP9_PODMU
ISIRTRKAKKRQPSSLFLAMAASGGAVQDLCEEATCSICLECFRDPVIIPECGHNFCRACLIQCWEKSEGEASCPLCREIIQHRTLIPNRPLANVVEILGAEKVSLPGGKGAEGKGRVCEKHQEPLKLFCKEEEAPICVVCNVSKEHKGHEVIPLEEALQEYKVGNLSGFPLGMVRVKELQRRGSCKKTEKMVAEFRRLHQFLEEQEKLLLAQMAEVEKEIAAKREEHLARLSRELSSLDSLIREMEEKLQEPESELLQVRPHPDVRGWSVLLQTTVVTRDANGIRSGAPSISYLDALSLNFLERKHAHLQTEKQRKRNQLSLPGAVAMAASGGPVMDLCEEATCSICLEYFQDPVIIPECGHNFCRSCLILYWGKSEGEASCPQCRKTVEQGSIRPNQQLANFVEITQKFSHLGGKKEAEGKGRVCEKHQEPLKLFCKEDEAPICLVCDRAKEHKSHEAVPIEEASLEYKVGKHSGSKQMQAEREKMVAEFRRLRQFLEEKEKLLLAQMAEVEKEIAAQREEHLARLSRELSSLDSLIREMEEKLQEPASELLQVRPHPDARGWQERRKWMVALKPMKRKGLFSLGPSWVKELTDIPERFDRHLYVLGSEVFKEYRCFWDVFVGSEGEWAVGVARESVKRKGKFIAGPTEGIWRIGKWGDQYRVSTCDGPPVLMLGGEPKRIRVALNCEGRRVSFYDANTAALLHSFSAASFSGETLQPFFYMFTKGHLTVS